MACFTCGKLFDTTENGILTRYKAAYERTGVWYWFYKVEGTKQLKITTSNGFKKFRESNEDLFKEGKVEFAPICEFGNNTDTTFLGNNESRKLSAAG